MEKNINEKINPMNIKKQIDTVVDTVKTTLDSDDDTAKKFIKSMVGENDEDIANRAIEYGVNEPEVNSHEYDDYENYKKDYRDAIKSNDDKINYFEKNNDNDLPFESVNETAKNKRTVVKTIKISDLKNGK